jgi:hypothetical protein
MSNDGAGSAKYGPVVAHLRTAQDAASAAEHLDKYFIPVVEGLLNVNTRSHDYAPAARNVADLADISARLAGISAELAAIAARS